LSNGYQIVLKYYFLQYIQLFDFACVLYRSTESKKGFTDRYNQFFLKFVRSVRNAKDGDIQVGVPLNEESVPLSSSN
jgi:hypothetical protein